MNLRLISSAAFAAVSCIGAVAVVIGNPPAFIRDNFGYAVLAIFLLAAAGYVQEHREERREALAPKATGIQLLDRRDEHEYDGPATLHYPEGGATR